MAYNLRVHPSIKGVVEYLARAKGRSQSEIVSEIILSGPGPLEHFGWAPSYGRIRISKEAHDRLLELAKEYQQSLYQVGNTQIAQGLRLEMGKWKGAPSEQYQRFMSAFIELVGSLSILMQEVLVGMKGFEGNGEALKDSLD